MIAGLYSIQLFSTSTLAEILKNSLSKGKSSLDETIAYFGIKLCRNVEIMDGLPKGTFQTHNAKITQVQEKRGMRSTQSSYA